MNVLCIAREAVYSPGKVEADRAILEAVAARLDAHAAVRVVDAEPLPPQPAPGTLVLAMCQGPEALRALRAWQRAGVRVINTPDAIEGCQRTRLLPALERAGVPHPASALIATAGDWALPEWAADGVWVKRGDVHATCADDVVLVGEPRRLAAAVEHFRARGIATVALQRHVAGEVIKFYAVTGRFFTGFDGAGAPLELDAAQRRDFASLVESAAAALRLEVFGGDCVRAVDGRLWLIDLNDWPSYGPCRSAAAEAIAEYSRVQSELS